MEDTSPAGAGGWQRAGKTPCWWKSRCTQVEENTAMKEACIWRAAAWLVLRATDGTGWPAALEPHLTSFLRFQSTYQSLEKDASIPVLGHMPTPRLMTLFITLRYSDQSGLCVHSWDREDGGT